MTGKIYLLQDDTRHEPRLQSLVEQPYDSEDLLQALLHDHPDLLAGDQMDESAPRRWLLVSREFGVPLEEEGPDRLSLDHLFLDQDAVPTLVEVKRSSDTRIRREVVGQMLDYAAHAVAYWSLGALRARFEAGCDDRGEDPAHLVAALIGADPGDDPAVESFWGHVKTNLQAGRIRLVFVADEIPAELHRVIEFLNRYTDPIEVLGVEIKQYVGEGLRTLVPRVIGQSAEARSRKQGSLAMARPWDAPSFFAELERRAGPEAAGAARAILDWANARGLATKWGTGPRTGTLAVLLDPPDAGDRLLTVYTYGGLEVFFQTYQHRPPFDAMEKRLELLGRLNAIDGIDIAPDRLAARPGIPLQLLADGAVRRPLLEALEWVAAEIAAGEEA
jgi:hypothetical protein